MADKLSLEDVLGRYKPAKWPKRLFTGQPCLPKRAINGLTTVQVGHGFFYVCPFGFTLAPNHDTLVELADTLSKPAAKRKPVKEQIDATEQKTTTD